MISNDNYKKPRNIRFAVATTILIILLVCVGIYFLIPPTENIETSNYSDNFPTTQHPNNITIEQYELEQPIYTNAEVTPEIMPATETPYTFSVNATVKYTPEELEKCSYLVDAANDHVDIYKQLDRASIQVLSMQVKNKYQKIETLCDSNNTLVIITNLAVNSDPNEGLDSEILTQIYTYELEKNVVTKLYEGLTYTGSLVDIAAATPDAIYFWKSHFEGPRSLIVFNTHEKIFDSVSHILGFWSYGESNVSPNKNYIAFTALSKVGDIVINRLSFFNIDTGELTHSKLTSYANGEWIRGVDHFKDIRWSADSAKVTITIDDGGADVAYKIDPSDPTIQNLIKNDIIFLAEEGTFKVGLDGNVVQ